MSSPKRSARQVLIELEGGLRDGTIALRGTSSTVAETIHANNSFVTRENPQARRGLQLTWPGLIAAMSAIISIVGAAITANMSWNIARDNRVIELQIQSADQRKLEIRTGAETAPQMTEQLAEEHLRLADDYHRLNLEGEACRQYISAYDLMPDGLRAKVAEESIKEASTKCLSGDAESGAAAFARALRSLPRPDLYIAEVTTVAGHVKRIRGVARQLPTAANIYVLVRPVGSSTWTVQSRAPVDTNGLWSADAVVGTDQDNSKAFEIQAIATPRDLPNEPVAPSEIERAAVASSGVVRVSTKY